jgi:hypothetical protein
MSTISFPNNKTLAPTRNLDRVMGKTFMTVGVEEKVREPISYNEFLRVRTEGLEEIVY